MRQTHETIHVPTEHALSMHNFTESVLVFWRRNWRKFPTWAKAASIVFSMTPSSAGAERVFSFLKLMFGDTRTTVSWPT